MTPEQTTAVVGAVVIVGQFIQRWDARRVAAKVKDTLDEATVTRDLKLHEIHAQGNGKLALQKKKTMEAYADLARQNPDDLDYRRKAYEAAQDYSDHMLAQARTDAEVADYLASRGKKPADKPKQFLVVEDDPLMAKMFRQLITDAGAQVDIAHTAEEALGLISNREYNIAFVDMRLPGLKGWDLIKRMSDSSAATECIAIVSEPADLVNLPYGRYFGIIIKPPTESAVRAVLALHCSK